MPPFFAHEGEIISLFNGEKVPALVASDQQRVLMRNLPGEDCYDANVDQMLTMLGLLVDLQWRWHERLPELNEAGLPDCSTLILSETIPAVIHQYLHELSDPLQSVLREFAASLPARLTEIEDCGMPSSLVHGDYHPGNWRGSGNDLTILDWGDCVVGHPLLDQPGLLDRAEIHRDQLSTHWQSLWQAKLPKADVARAWALIAPVATARMAVVYQGFLDNIEPSERIYHDTDPVLCLRRTAEILLDTS